VRPRARTLRGVTRPVQSADAGSAQRGVSLFWRDRRRRAGRCVQSDPCILPRLRGLRSLCAPGEVTDTVRACAVDARSLTSAPRQRRFSRPNRMSFHARLPRRHVGRTDPIAPCDGDARIVRAVWGCRISLRAIELRGLVFKGTAHAHCGITFSVIPGERSETRDPVPRKGRLPLSILGPGSRAGNSAKPICSIVARAWPG
jgi:hypothetical protein